MLKTLVIVAGLATVAVVLLKTCLMRLRNERGLYGWPRPVQFLICLFDGIPLSAVGQFPSQAAFMETQFTQTSAQIGAEIARRSKPGETVHLSDGSVVTFGTKKIYPR